MSCAHPIPAVDLGSKVNDKGEVVRNIKLLDMRHKYYGFGLEELKEKFGDSLILLPCGHCYSCGVEYSRTWASRIMLEAQHYENNCFITLTYNDIYCPPRLSKRDVQLFIKRLRKEVSSSTQIRYFLCGEYGEKSALESSDGYGRPHYHAIIFGYDFPDKELLSKSKSGMMIYRSPMLERLWPFGISSIGSVSSESAQYVAKYSLKKKVSGKDSGEFVLMSRRPGIGAAGYHPSIWRTGRIYVGGKTYKAPRYFEKLAVQDNDFMFDVCKSEREIRGKTYKSQKYLYGLQREEEALELLNNQKIENDARKVRL